MSFIEDKLAYERLKKRGLQPRRIDGCAELERQNPTRASLAYPTLTPDQLAEAVEGLAEAVVYEAMA